MADTTPAVPAAEGVAVAGKKPYPPFLDPDHSGIPLYDRKAVRDAIAGVLFKVIMFLFPGSPWALLLAHFEDDLQRLIDTGAK